jgi:hypothetical protein
MFESRKLAGNIHGQILADNITEQRGSEGYSFLNYQLTKFLGKVLATFLGRMLAWNIPRQSTGREYNRTEYVLPRYIPICSWQQLSLKISG